MLSNIPIKDEIIIASGKFGSFFNNWWNANTNYNNKLIIVNGGLRVGNKIDLSYIKDYIKNKKFIFIDDSFYSGKTRNTIKNELEKYNANLNKTYVIYDGSKARDDNVCSLYRYYD